MQFCWAEEAAEKTETEATFRQIELVAHKLIGYTRASDELLDDSAISLTDFLSGPMGMAGGIAWMEDYAFFQGTGSGQPLGVIPAPATINEGRNAAGAISFDDLADMMEDFLPTGNGLWTITQSAMSEIIQLNGPATNPSYIWQPNARDGVPGYILGFPVTWSEKVPLIGNNGDVVLADWRYYLIGDRQATTLETTQYDYWRYDQTSWRAVHRVDGQPWLSLPLTYQDGTTQVSPFVILAGVTGS
jgi:HK97 family phage major capsid protein